MPSLVEATTWLLAAVSSAVILFSLMIAPRLWRERRWAIAHGADDEREIGRALWLKHLAVIAAGISFWAIAVRRLLIDGPYLRPSWIIISALIGSLACVLLLMAQIRLRRAMIRPAYGQRRFHNVAPPDLDEDVASD